ncbi:hypothetical protein [Natronorubrum halophilum]|uniref:hypothetical protein n=1 Tax=Natronorubrum halophilum TaxID=1702106 RepID=UPI0013CED549|nr:hypothetical protein [Natronorubrum halophilum]
MAAQTNLSVGVLNSVESIAAWTDRWWYLPALSGVSAAVLIFLVYFTATPEWALETVAVLSVLPATVLAGPAIVFDILNKYDDTLPPGLFIYPPALLVAMIVGMIPLITVVTVYLITWVIRV